MSWITPVLNWVAGAIPTKDDFNRIEGNTKDNHDRIDDIENGSTKVSKASYADNAGSANNADNAANAQKIEGNTLDEIKPDFMVNKDNLGSISIQKVGKTINSYVDRWNEYINISGGGKLLIYNYGTDEHQMGDMRITIDGEEKTIGIPIKGFWFEFESSIKVEGVVSGDPNSAWIEGFYIS